MVFSSKQASHFLFSWRENSRIRILKFFSLSLSSSCLSHYSFGSQPHNESLQFDRIAICLLNFLHPLEGKCIEFDCRFDSATTPPPISFEILVWLSPSPRRSTREELKRPSSPPLSNKGASRPFPNWQSAKYKSTISGR